MILCRIGVRNFSKSSHLNLRGGNSRIKDLLENAASGEDRKPKTEEDTWSTTPYPKDAVFNNKKRDQGKKRDRVFKDPRDTSIVLFPGQGSQYVGMAKDLVKIPEAMDMFALASEVLG
jgi:[acyl-carrier-protein] S-malonyltransferase